MHWELGTIPQWLAAPALLITTLALAFEQRKNRREHTEKHAVNVSAWVDRRGTPSIQDLDRFREFPWPTDVGNIGWVVVVRLRNGNPVPVYRLQYSVPGGVKGTPVGSFWVVPPECTLEFLVPFPSPPRSDLPWSDIAFFDAAGNKWLRRGNGVLRKLKKRDDPLQEHPGSFPSVQDHPTLSIPHPYRVVAPGELPAAGRLEFNREPPSQL